MSRVGHFVAALALLAPSLVYAAGSELTDQSVLAAGAGGAGVARQGDPGVVWYNPAALADGAGFRGGVSTFLAIPHINAQSTDARYAPTDQATSTNWGVSTPFAAHLGWSGGRFGAGVYVGTPFGASVSWPNGWWGQYDAVSTSLTVIRTAPSFAVRLGRLRIGAGLHVDWANLDLQRALDFVDTAGNSHLTLSGANAGGDASLFVEASETVSIGLTYQSRTAIHLDGNAHFQVPAEFAGKAPDQRASSDLTLPDRFALGVGWTRGKNAVFADATVTLWEVNETQVVHFTNPATTDVTQAQHWSPSFAIHAGVERSVSARMIMRAGAYYDHQAAPDNTLSPTSPDMSRIGLTLGGSLKLGRAVVIDDFVGVAFLLPRTSTSADAVPASYSGFALFGGLAFRAAQPGAPVIVRNEPPAPSGTAFVAAAR
jgi:long-chain fatty acid transport protein